jgi:hypothetical protein
MPAALPLSGDQRALVDDFAASLTAAGMGAGPERLWAAKAFCARVGLPADWSALPLAAQCALPPRVRGFVGWLFVTGRLAASADYLVACPQALGGVAARHHPGLHLRFADTARALGFTAGSTLRQWSAVARVAALHRVTPDGLTAAMLDAGRSALEAALRRHRPAAAVERG